MPIFQITVDGKTLNINAVSREALQNKYPGAYVNPIPRPASRIDSNQLADLRGDSLFFPRATGRRDEITLDQAYQQQASGLPVSPTPSESIGGLWGGIGRGIGGGIADAYNAVQMGGVFGEGQPPGVPPTPQDRTLELAARAGGSPPTRTNTVFNEEEARDVAQGQQLLANLPRRPSRGTIGDEIDPATGLPFTTVPRPPTVDRTIPVVPSAPSAALAGRGAITDEIDPTTGLPFTTVPRMAAPDDRYISPYNMPFDTSSAAAAARFREQFPATPPPATPPPVAALPSAAAGGGGEIDPNTGVPFVTPTAPATGTGTGPFGVGTGITVRAPLGQPGQSELFGMGLPSLEEQSLGAVFAQYLQDQGAGRGVNPLVSNYARGQGQTAQQLFGAAQRIGGGNPDIDEASQFRDFLSRTPNYGTQSLLGTAMGDISRSVGQGMLPGSEQFSRFNPQNISEGSDLANLARAASQRNVSPFIRRDFYQRPGLTNDQLFDTFAANRDRGNAQGFADYLGQTFGLRDFGSQLGLA